MPTERFQCPICKTLAATSRPVTPKTDAPVCRRGHEPRPMDPLPVPAAETEIGGAKEQAGRGW